MIRKGRATRTGSQRSIPIEVDKRRKYMRLFFLTNSENYGRKPIDESPPLSAKQSGKQSLS